MDFTGKNAQQFTSWLISEYNSTIPNILTEFQKMPISGQWGYYQEYADSKYCSLIRVTIKDRIQSLKEFDEMVNGK